MTVELRPHQLAVLDKLSNGKILYGGTGVGKSMTSLAYYFTRVCGGVLGSNSHVEHQKDLYVITTAKKRDSLDWEKEALEFGISTVKEFSLSGVAIKVDSWNNIHKYTGVKNAFFIFDEQRLVGAGAWVKAFLKIVKANEWILLSATPGDTWLDYIPVFVANGWYKNRTDFKRRHVVYNTFTKFPKVDRYVDTGVLVRRRNQVLVHMPYEKHTVRHTRHIRVPHDKELFRKVIEDRWHVYENRPIRDVAELFRVMRMVANTDGSRLTELGRLLGLHDRLIVFYNFDYELELIRSWARLQNSSTGLEGTIWEDGFDEKGVIECLTKRSVSTTSSTGQQTQKGDGFSNVLVAEATSPTQLFEREGTTSTTLTTGSGSMFQLAEWNGHKHQPIPDSTRWLYLVQYGAGSEGWNCVETDAVVFYSLTYSYRQFHQAYGRIDRLNTVYTDLWYYILQSDALIDRAIWNALGKKKSFNEASSHGFAIKTAKNTAKRQN